MTGGLWSMRNFTVKPALSEGVRSHASSESFRGYGMSSPRAATSICIKQIIPRKKAPVIGWARGKSTPYTELLLPLATAQRSHRALVSRSPATLRGSSIRAVRRRRANSMFCRRRQVCRIARHFVLTDTKIHLLKRFIKPAAPEIECEYCQRSSWEVVAD